MKVDPKAEKLVRDYVKFLRKLAAKIDDTTDWCALRSQDIAELGSRVHSLNDVAEELERRWEKAFGPPKKKATGKRKLLTIKDW